MVGLKDKTNQRPASLSGGERQRVAIARALVNYPAIVWADEPTGNLDRKTSEDIMDLMKRLNGEKGQTFVIVTHDIRVGRKCDRILHMRDGVLVSQDEDIDELTEELKDEH
jgi:ABC-type lipoprotein export system ATPase subunit